MKRRMRAVLAALLSALTVAGPTPAAASTDWSVAVVRSTMERFTPATLGGWSYPVALYLLGQYEVYERTGDATYLAYVKKWVDRFVDNKGGIGQTFNSLDSMLAGRLLLVLYR